MDALRIDEVPSLRDPVFVGAFRGWVDAQEAATRAVRYLVRRLPAKHFASIDPEEFFDFSQVRPYTMLLPSGERVIQWPRNEFYYWRGEGVGRDLVLCLGTEPSLRWRTFTDAVLEVTKQCGVTSFVTVGALLDAVPHTREPQITGNTGGSEFQRGMEGMKVGESGYQGPTGIHGVLSVAFRREGYSWATLMGHAPHYIQGLYNPKVSYALLGRLAKMLDLTVDLERMRLAQERFDREVEQVLEERPELKTYVQQLESQYEESLGADEPREVPDEEELPDPQAMVEELEEFLHRQQQGGREDTPSE